MEIVELPLAGLKLLKPRLFTDERGFFRECYRENLYAAHGITTPFVQDNHSYSVQGTLRGMHFQAKPGQAKLVSVVVGEIFDVVVDIRPDSPTFRKWFGVSLDGKKGEQLYVPVGFAHGFYVASPSAHILYKVSHYYDPEQERTFRFDDPEIGIAWPVQNPLLSAKDLNSSSLRSLL
jgi:dTDP-4-dehydrorhamnose 3,5-epimerase